MKLYHRPVIMQPVSCVQGTWRYVKGAGKDEVISNSLVPMYHQLQIWTYPRAAIQRAQVIMYPPTQTWQKATWYCSALRVASQPDLNCNWHLISTTIYKCYYKYLSKPEPKHSHFTPHELWSGLSHKIARIYNLRPWSDTTKEAITDTMKYKMRSWPLGPQDTCTAAVDTKYYGNKSWKLQQSVSVFCVPRAQLTSVCIHCPVHNCHYLQTHPQTSNRFGQ